jgi:hypothetical protein
MALLVELGAKLSSNMICPSQNWFDGLLAPVIFVSNFYIFRVIGKGSHGYNVGNT